MSSHDSLSAIRRILIAMDASASGTAALEATVALASLMEAELLGIFIKDINLLRYAALPFAREVGYPSARTRRLGSAEMELSLQAQASRAEVALLAAAERWHVRCSFRTVLGEITTQLLAAAHDVDLVSIGITRRPLWHTSLSVPGIISAAPGSLLFLPAGARIGPPVMMIYDGSPVSQKALSVAQRLARQEDDGLIILLSGNDGELRQQVSQQLAGSGLVTRYHELSGTNVAGLAQMVRAAAVGTLVVGGNLQLKAGKLEDLLEQLDCAVFLVR